MDELRALRSLAKAMGVHTRYTDGLGRHVLVAPETLVRVCAALGAPVANVGDAVNALRALETGGGLNLVPPVLVAWDGILPPLEIVADGPIQAELRLESGAVVPLETSTLPFGYHQLTVEADGRREMCT
ncbi:MAG TPA: hypothetical protein VLB49_15615, partial [Gemmatimonadales bacterium]|nr:hypothetical protein [Gemmatimonadales bacterium]